MKLMRAMATVGGLTGVSRIAGFARDILTASILGAGPIADAFFVALKLPNFFRRVTAEGAFSVSFVPMYSEKMEKETREQADRFASNMFAWMSVILTVFCTLAILFMPVIIRVIAPGFEHEGMRYTLAITLSRITFFYLLLISLSALLGGILNALGRFAPFAFAPVLFNLCLIAGLLLADNFETAGHALAWAILTSGFLQFGFLLYCVLKARVGLRLMWPIKTQNTTRVLNLMIPGVIGAGVMHINLFADIILASFLKTGSISYLYYADRLNQLPLGTVGIAVGTALLPMLSSALAKDNMKEAKNLFNRAMEVCLLFTLPAAAALIVIAEPIISTLFERGEFDAAASLATARVLQAYVIGLPAYVAIKVFSTAHWARQDTRTPVKISIIATLCNIGLSILFIKPFGAAGIALGTGLTAWLQFFMHRHYLKNHPAVEYDEKFKSHMPRIVFATTLMATIVALLYHFVLIDNTHHIIMLAILVVVGMTTYGLSCMVLGVISPKQLKAIVKGKT